MRKPYFRILMSSALSACVTLSGCAIHPLPEDVTNLTTYDIVRQIRCETAEAGKKLVLDALHKWTDAGFTGSLAASTVSLNILNHYNNDPQGFFANLNPDKEFTKESAGENAQQFAFVLDSIYSLGLAYAFQLNMTSQGSINPSAANFLGPWASKFTLGVAADFTGTRNNQRQFATTDTMRQLFKDLAVNSRAGVRISPYCDGYIRGPNQTYPIAGEIGVYKTLWDYLNLAIFTNLSPAKTGAQPLADQLIFTTTIDLSLAPKVVFTPVGPNFQATDLSGTFGIRRVDMHQVTIGVATNGAAAQAQVEELGNFAFSRTPAPTPAAKAAEPAVKLGAPATFNTFIVTPRTMEEFYAAKQADILLSRQLQITIGPR